MERPREVEFMYYFFCQFGPLVELGRYGGMVHGAMYRSFIAKMSTVHYLLQSHDSQTKKLIYT